jgi:hypothetical protein
VRNRSAVSTGDGSFDSATFEAKISEVKGMPSGELRVVLLIPESDSKEGRTLLDAYAHALQVKVSKMRYEQ